MGGKPIHSSCSENSLTRSHDVNFSVSSHSAVIKKKKKIAIHQNAQPSFCPFDGSQLTRYQFNAILRKILSFCGLHECIVLTFAWVLQLLHLSWGCLHAVDIQRIWVVGGRMQFSHTLGLLPLPVFLKFKQCQRVLWIIGDSTVRWAKQPLGLSCAVLWNSRSGAIRQ